MAEKNSIPGGRSPPAQRCNEQRGQHQVLGFGSYDDDEIDDDDASNYNDGGKFIIMMMMTTAMIKN